MNGGISKLSTFRHPRGFGASTPKLIVQAVGAGGQISWTSQTDLFFYDADSVTGLIDDQPAKGKVTPTVEYLELAIELSKDAGTFLLDDELPAYSEQQTFGKDLGLMSGKNWVL